MTFFTGIHDVPARDKTREWDQSRVVTDHFDVAKQPVASYQNPWELAQMIEVYVKLQPKSYLELGPYHGGTLYWFIMNSIVGTKIGAVDFFDGKLGGFQAFPSDWSEWCKSKSVDFAFFEGNTHDETVIESVGEYFDGSLDWLLIDATHDYDDVRQDLNNYGQFLHEGSVLAFHDVRPRNMGSCRLWEEMRQAGYKSQLIVADPTSETVDAGIGLIYL